MNRSYIHEQRRISKITLWLSSCVLFFIPFVPTSSSPTPIIPAVCRFPTRWQAAGKDPPQHNSPITQMMSAEGEIKMKKSRSSGEVRRQRAFMRLVQSDDESKEKQNSSEVKLQSWGAHRGRCLMISHNVLSWHCFNSDSAFFSAMLVSVMEPCNYSRLEPTDFGNCCVRVLSGCFLDLQIVTLCVLELSVLSCAAEREVRTVGSKTSESNWGDVLVVNFEGSLLSDLNILRLNHSKLTTFNKKSEIKYSSSVKFEWIRKDA